MKPYMAVFAWMGVLLGILIHSEKLMVLLIIVPLVVSGIHWGSRQYLYSVVFCAGIVAGWLSWWPLPPPPPALKATRCDVLHQRVSSLQVQCDRWKLVIYPSADMPSVMEGQFILVSGTIERFTPQPVPLLFDYARYQTHQGFSGVLRVSQIHEIGGVPSWSAVTRQALLAQLSSEQASYIEWLVFGQRLEGPLNDRIQFFSLVDLMVVSGLHIQFLITVLLKLVAQGRPQIVDRWITLVLLLPLGYLMGWPISMVRSLALAGISTLMATFHWNWRRMDRLAFIGAGMLLFNSRWLFHTGYQFSFLATSALVVSDHVLHAVPKQWRPFVVNGWMTTVLLPLLVMSRFELSLWSPILHWLLSPLIVILFLVALLCLIGCPIGFVLVEGFRWLDHLLSTLEQWPLLIPMGAFQAVAWWAWYLAFALIVLVVHPRWRWVRNVASLTWMLIVILQWAQPVLQWHYEVIFFDVEQGDATLIITPFHQEVILIDTGGMLTYDLATQRLIPYLRARLITRIDAVIITHQDFDHDGALTSLLAYFTVHEVIRNSLSTTVAVGGFQLINYNPQPSSEENDDSMVLGFELYQTQYLIMGDASVDVEHRILDHNPHLRADVLRLGHHGSQTSTSDRLLSTLQPDLAILSVGERNRYGHPHLTVLQRLASYHIPTYSTANHGTLIIRQYPQRLTLTGTLNLI